MRTGLTALVVVATVGCGSAARVSRGDLTVYTFNHDSANAHLLVHGSSMVLVDAGYESNAPKLEADLRAEGIDPAKIRAIVLTHGHADHAGGARYFQQRFRIPVVVGAGDRAMLATGTNEKLCPTGLLGKWRHSTDQSATFTPTVADTLVTEPIALDRWLGVEGTIAPLPGHTNGSLVVIAGDVAVVGDLFRGALVGSGAATHLYMCDEAGNKRDIAKLLGELAPRAAVFFVGHFGPVERGDVAERFGVLRSRSR